MVSDEQVLPSIKPILDEAWSLYKTSVSVTQTNSITDTGNIPIENPQHWLKVPDVICVYVDMRGST